MPQVVVSLVEKAKHPQGNVVARAILNVVGTGIQHTAVWFVMEFYVLEQHGVFPYATRTPTPIRGVFHSISLSILHTNWVFVLLYFADKVLNSVFVTYTFQMQKHNFFVICTLLKISFIGVS